MRGARPVVAGVVVLYRPGPWVLDNVASYQEDLDLLVVVDNTERPSGELVEALRTRPGVVYLSRPENVGVATALNIGAGEAERNGCGLLLTMDQDSRAEEGMVAALVDAALGPLGEGTGILSAHPLTRYGRPPPAEPDVQKSLVVISSGSLVSLETFRSVGPFLDELFIDCVDVEYCLRLVCRGYKVLTVNRARLVHAVGDPTRHRFLFRDYTTTNHSALRRYYMTRNRLHVTRAYREAFPKFCADKRRQIFRDMRRIILFEADKLTKIRMMVRGYQDYRGNRLGKVWEPGLP